MNTKRETLIANVGGSHLEEDEDDLESGAHAAATTLVHSFPHTLLKRQEEENEHAYHANAHPEGRGWSADAWHTVERNGLEETLLAQRTVRALRRWLGRQNERACRVV